MTTVVVLQPGYLPWIGFFNQLARSDVFVYYDDVQYDKHGWRNRNRIKSPTGPIWLTVPVRSGGRHGQRIIDAEIDNREPWARKHIAAIAQNYSRAPYLQKYFPQLQSLLAQEWRYLVDLNIATTDLLCNWLGLISPIERSSLLGIGGKQSERLLDICKRFGATRYVSGDSAKSYLDLDLFAKAGITVEWQSYCHPNYSQQHGEFIPYMSVIDLVLNKGPESYSIVKGIM